MKKYKNITFNDDLAHRQYVALMCVLPKYGIQHQTEVADILGMTQSCWAHRCGGQRLLLNIGELHKLADKLNMSDEDIVRIVRGIA